MREIHIQFAIGSGQKTFPVFYAVEDRKEDCLQIFRCTVALPEPQLPAWLCPGKFDLVTHVRDGIQVIDYNASSHQPNSAEEEWFRYKVYAEIFFHERRKHKTELAEC
jgi:hypothetical protein